jgi:hypothetical protein
MPKPLSTTVWDKRESFCSAAKDDEPAKKPWREKG